MKKLMLMILAAVLIAAAGTSCSQSSPESGSPSDVVTGSESTDAAQDLDDIYADSLAAQDFGGAPFRIAARNEHWLYVIYDAQEENGELINDAVYRRNRKIEERFNVKITQDVLDDVAGTLQKNVNAGVDAYELYLPVDREALTYGANGAVYKISDIPNIDLSKPYWSQTLNKSLTMGGELYFAYGSFNLSVYDYTHVLLFNKQMITDLGAESPYELVRSGNWTFEKYAEMAKQSVRDLDGNGAMDSNDQWGFYSLDKHVLPCFWIGAGVKSISKSAEDIPQYTLRDDEKFINVIEKIFEITYDNNSRYPGELPEEDTIRFIDGNTLFADSTFKGVGDLRSIETDFGIIPYPKFTAEQSDYYTRVEGGNPGVVPVTAENLQMIGTVLESLNSESAKTVIPAYYDVTLKTKYARDEQSAEMLDLIFESRVYDLGDTYWCSILRDGIFLTMYSKNDRSIISQLEKVEPKITAEIDKVVQALQ